VNGAEGGEETTFLGKGSLHPVRKKQRDIDMGEGRRILHLCSKRHPMETGKVDWTSFHETWGGFKNYLQGGKKGARKKNCWDGRKD